MQGPVALDWLLPTVEAGFARAGLGVDVSMSGVRLGIDGATRQLDLRVDDVHLSLRGGEPLASFPEMVTSFSLGSLIEGRLSPTRLTVERPVVALSRDKTGAVSFRIGDTGQKGGLGLAALLIGPARPDGPMGQLTQIRIHDATVTVDDELLGKRWQAGHLDAAIARDGDGSAGDLSVAVTIGGDTTEVQANYRYAAARQKLDLGVSADKVHPDALAPLLPLLAPLEAVHIPVSGTVQTQYSFDEHKFEGMRADLALAGGRIDSAQFSGGHLAIQGGELQAVYAPETQSVRLDKLRLDLGGGAELAIDGHLGGVTRGFVAAGGAKPAILPGHLDVSLTHLPIERADAVWPRALSPGGRRWAIENVHDGMLDEASARIDFKLDTGNRAADLGAVSGRLRYRDVSVTYLGGLPPIRGLAGTATIGGTEVDFAPQAGGVKGLRLTGGTVRVYDLDTHDEKASVDLAVAGPLRDALEIIDAKPLRYAHAAGIDPAGIGGKAEAQLHFKFPLIDALKLDDIDYGAKVSLSGASIAKVALGRNLSDGDLAVGLSRAGVQIKGEARFDGIPATVAGDLVFHPKPKAPHAVYQVGLVLDDAARHRLDEDLSPDRLSGPVGVELTYSVREGGHATADLTADLRGARLSVAEAGWEKPPGQPGTARIDFNLDHDSVTGPIKLAVAARGLDGHFAIALAPSRDRTERVEINRLVVGPDDFAGSVTRRGAGWHAELTGRRFDLHPLLKHVLARDKGPPPAPLSIVARLDRVSVGPGRAAQAVVAQLNRANGAWQTIRVDAAFANNKHLAFRLGGEAGPHRVSIASDDLGSALRLFDVVDNVVGGKMLVTGQLVEGEGRPALRAQIVGSDYSVVRAPVFTRILSLGSFTGMSSAVSGSGIPFASLRGSFTYSDDGVVLDKLLASGESLGLTASGSVDLVHDRLDLTGTIAPAHAINSALGKVPVIGSLLMGGEGQSLFAANYELSGSTDDPSVSVNPLSAIAPGFLRRLFVVPNFDGGEMPPQPKP